MGKIAGFDCRLKSLSAPTLGSIQGFPCLPTIASSVISYGPSLSYQIVSQLLPLGPKACGWL